MGTLSIALLLALGLSGIVYGGWSDTLLINAEVHTGAYGIAITAGGGSNQYITCWVDPNFPATLHVELDDTVGVLPGDYSCTFTAEDTGVIPVTAQNPVIFPDPPATGATVNVTDMSGNNFFEGTQIDPGAAGAKWGRVNVHLAEAVSDFAFTVTFSVIPWNQ